MNLTVLPQDLQIAFYDVMSLIDNIFQRQLAESYKLHSGTWQNIRNALLSLLVLQTVNF